MLKLQGLCCAVALLASLSGSAWAQTRQPSGCFVAHFKALALNTQPPAWRAELAEKWLQKYALVCTDAQLASIQANSPSWLGTGLTHEIASILEGAIEAKISGNPELMGKLYESAGKEGQKSIDSFATPAARAPVVQGMVNNGVIAGSANYGNISGNTTVNKNTNNLANASSNNAANSQISDSPNAASAQGNAPRMTIGSQQTPR